MLEKYVTTTQAAKICNVTRFTIRNWANNGKLRSERTVGGHRRIALDDLNVFLHQYHMNGNTEQLSFLDVTACYDYPGCKDSDQHNCGECLVSQMKASKCFVLANGVGKGKVQCTIDCVDCEYIMSNYPEEWARLNNELKPVSAESQEEVRKEVNHEENHKEEINKEELDEHGRFYRGLFASGKYLASVGKVFQKNGKKGKRHSFSEDIKNGRKRSIYSKLLKK